MTAEALRLHCIAVPAEIADQIRLITAESPEWILTWAFSSDELPPCDALVMPAELFSRVCRQDPLLTYRVQVLPFGPARLLPPALTQGAADYLKSPWDAAELFVRLRRRLAELAAVPGHRKALLWRSCLRTERASVPLSASEIRIARLLMRFAGEAVSRRALYFAIWGHEGEDSRAVDVHISALRKKMRAIDPEGAAVSIRTVRGEGYMLDAPAELWTNCE